MKLFGLPVRELIYLAELGVILGAGAYLFITGATWPFKAHKAIGQVARTLGVPSSADLLSLITPSREFQIGGHPVLLRFLGDDGHVYTIVRARLANVFPKSFSAIQHADLTGFELLRAGDPVRTGDEETDRLLSVHAEYFSHEAKRFLDERRVALLRQLAGVPHLRIVDGSVEYRRRDYARGWHPEFKPDPIAPCEIIRQVAFFADAFSQKD